MEEDHAKTERGSVARSRKMKVLVVDNEEEFAATLAARLTLRNITAASAFSGSEALAALEEFRPDVVILDLQMPDMNGLAVLAQIKAMRPATDVILMTGHGSLENGIAGMESGAFDYLVKPVELDTLLERIADAFQRHHTPQT